MATADSYPVRVEADLEEGLSRWLWLVKWFLAVPHYVVLAFLWMAYGVLTAVAFFAILFTGRYPRSIFEFNVGVLRWSWRVADYSFGVLATDRYPPFTLADVPDYPAHLDVEYPAKLSRGLVLIKWWLLAIPHLIIVGILAGGGTMLAWNVGNDDWTVGGNLIGVLVLVAAVMLAFTGRYPQPLFNLILGLNRWVIRVAAYVGLMTDQYPPFRLDMGGREPGAGTAVAGPAGPAAPVGTAAPASDPHTWTAGPIIALVIGALMAMTSVGFLGGGAATIVVDQTQRDAAGFLSTPTGRLTVDTYAIVTDDIAVHIDGAQWVLEQLMDQARIRVTPVDPSDEVFVGIGPTDRVDAYLSGVARSQIDRLADADYRTFTGSAPAAPPAEQTFWASSTSGIGTRSLTWQVEEGTWTVVVMDADGARGVDVRANVGGTIPALTWVGAGLLVAGLVLLVVGMALVFLAIRGARRPA